MNKKGFSWSFVSVGVIFLVLWAICNISPIADVLKTALSVLSPVIGGLCLAFVLNIPLSFIERIWIRLFSARRRGLRRGVCLFICILLTGAVASFFVWLIVPQIIETVRDRIIPRIPFYIEEITVWYGRLSQWLAARSIELPALDSKDILDSANLYIENNLHSIVDKSFNIASTIFGAIFDAIIALAISIYILLQKESLSGLVKKVIFAVLPKKSAERTITLANLTEKTFARFIGGQIIEAFILGILCFIGMLIFKMPFPVVISVMIGVTALIPIFGAFMGAGVGAALILVEEPTKALWFILFIIVLQQIEGNLIYPRVVGTHVGLPGLWVLVAVTIGSEFGIVGMLIAVPVASLIYTTITQVVNAKLEEKGYDLESFGADEDKPLKKKKNKKKALDSLANENVEEVRE